MGRLCCHNRMKNYLPLLLGAVAALFSASCAYDPYYSPGVASASYSTGFAPGFGPGFGYGHPGFSTSVFVATGNPRWGYDPHCFSYYDFNRRCYYDPYLNGYYPIGFRPPVVFGVPHPHGWRPGRAFCPPPVGVHSVTIHNYRNREALYRRSNYAWSNQVRQQSVDTGRFRNRGAIQEGSFRQRPFSRSSTRENPLMDSNAPAPRNFSGPAPRQSFRGDPRGQMGNPGGQGEARFRQPPVSRRQEAPPATRSEIRGLAAPDEASPPLQPMATPQGGQGSRGGLRSQMRNPFSGESRRGPQGRN
jgi:hypothetical protein